MIDDALNIHAPHITTPQPSALSPILLDDIIPPRYPSGCVLVFQRPGELGVVVSIPIPAGSMIMTIPPEQAAHVRAQIRQHQAKAAGKNGALGGSS